MPPLYELAILTPDRVVFEGKASSLVAPASEGYLGVLARHAPMVAELTSGELSALDETGGRRLYAVAGGFLEVTWGRVSVLADAAEAAADIDVARAEAARERAEQRLRAHDSSLDIARAEAALRRALNRLRVAGKRSSY